MFGIMIIINEWVIKVGNDFIVIVILVSILYWLIVVVLVMFVVKSVFFIKKGLIVLIIVWKMWSFVVGMEMVSSFFFIFFLCKWMCCWLDIVCFVMINCEYK